MANMAPQSGFTVSAACHGALAYGLATNTADYGVTKEMQWLASCN